MFREIQLDSLFRKNQSWIIKPSLVRFPTTKQISLSHSIRVSTNRCHTIQEFRIILISVLSLTFYFRRIGIIPSIHDKALVLYWKCSYFWILDLIGCCAWFSVSRKAFNNSFCTLFKKSLCFSTVLVHHIVHLFHLN